MRHVLVTGGAGFIGSNFVRYLLRAEPAVRVITLDCLTYAGSLANLADLPDPARHRFVRGDIADRPNVEALLRDEDVDTIVHFAAESHVDRSIYGSRIFLETNIMGTSALLEAARTVWLDERRRRPGEVRFHHVSTDEVFGSLGPGDPPWDETTPYAPRSPYAASKAASDLIVRAFAHTYGLPVTISNCTNNYGPCQFPEKLIPLLIFNALDAQALPIYGDGRHIRDWLHVDDHCAAVHRILQAGRLGETYAIAGGNQTNSLQISQQVCTLMDRLRPDPAGQPHARLITHVADRPGNDERYALSTAKIERELGWRPTLDLPDGLERTVRWYLDHPAWMAAIRRQETYQQWLQRNYAQRPPAAAPAGA